MRIILVRHGETLFNKMGLTQGWCDSPLTKKGIRQAQATGSLLKDIKIDEAYSSISERAYDTACYVLGDRKIPVKMDKRLKEVNFGVFEGQPDHVKNVAAGTGFDVDFTPFGGENCPDAVDRQVSFLDELLLNDHGQTVLIAGHGLSLSMLTERIAAKSLEERFPDFAFFGNATAVVLNAHDGIYEVENILGEFMKKSDLEKFRQASQE